MTPRGRVGAALLLLVAVCMVRAYPQSLNQTPTGSEEGIVFPDQKLVVPLLGKDDPDCAKGLTYCENVNGYPNDQIVQLISKETSMYKSLFGTDVWMPEIANRISPDEELCKYNEQIVFPKVGKNKDEKWTWIANTPEFKQGVRVEECQNTNSECQLVSNWPIGYKTECKQKYILRRMLSVTGDGSPSADDFLFPSCCVCSVKKVEEK
ncbi:protein spaetzle isoform X3 [Bacillus rossius redtenbacheri]|uniref:protein spaetzle isoform X3 n=1 Tax=Bacillus rossius redtenbacheri TaxID=93214 RepID=UPI002FDEE8D2